MLTTIPFAGFYDSVHDAELDDQLERTFSDRDSGCHVNEKLVNHAFDAIDWAAVHLKYAQAYCENFAEEFKIKLKYESMSSPREYNFGTDRIFATISEREVRRIRKATGEEILRKFAADRFTSRSGFISHYSPDIDEWGGIAKWDHNQVGTLIAAYAEQETTTSDGFDSWAELSLMERDFGNGAFDQWVGETSTRIHRLWNIWYYLDVTRKERSKETA